jgi:hypothetical protein
MKYAVTLNSIVVSGTIFNPNYKREYDTVALAFCNQPYGSAYFRLGLLRICLPHEYIDEFGGVAFQEAKASNQKHTQVLKNGYFAW